MLQASLLVPIASTGRVSPRRGRTGESESTRHKLAPFRYEDLIEGLQLPNPDGRHVLAAAIRGRADVIVTEDLKDFSADILPPSASRRSIRIRHTSAQLGTRRRLQGGRPSPPNPEKPPKTLEEYSGHARNAGPDADGIGVARVHALKEKPGTGKRRR